MPDQGKKIVIMGRPGTGKTSLKKVVFEGVNPMNLLINTLEPTRTVDAKVYTFLDLKLGVFDTAGQELASLLKNSTQMLEILNETNVVIYMIDLHAWELFKDSLLEDIKKIDAFIKKNSLSTIVVIFMHKIDKLTIEEAPFAIAEIREEITKEIELPIYFTSLFPHLLYHSFFAFYDIIHGFSETSSRLRTLLENHIKNYPGAMGLVLNDRHNILAQVFGKKVEMEKLNSIMSCVVGYSSVFKHLFLDDTIKMLSLTTDNEMVIILKHLAINANSVTLAVISTHLDFQSLLIPFSEIALELRNQEKKII